MYLQYYFPSEIPNFNFDIVNLDPFLTHLFSNSGQLGHISHGPIHMYTIKANNIVYTVHPNVITQAYEMYGLP